MCAKNHLLIFSSFVDIWENVEWPRFFGPPGRDHLLQRGLRCRPDTAQTTHVGAECRPWLYMLTEVDCTTRPFARQLSVKALTVFDYFYAKFVPKYKTHRKYVHLCRPKNKRPKNKKMLFSAPKTKKKTKFGRPVV